MILSIIARVIQGYFIVYTPTTLLHLKLDGNKTLQRNQKYAVCLHQKHAVLEQVTNSKGLPQNNSMLSQDWGLNNHRYNIHTDNFYLLFAVAAILLLVRRH